ncbi:TNF receptor-associated factor 6-like [Acropora millepora]|uniref:TNF receptor-associated factor 6-like n=1 Tax=Acropora millepora TaxID=45264 RepID=UPI001CF1DD9B|nr:TNF receptor-associated factor 6-like [Acropora millepora]
MDSPSKMVFDSVQFDEGIPAQYLCDVCKNPLLDAQIATPCGHSFCGFCVETFQATNGGGNITCQMCRQSVVVFCQNRLANNMLAMVEGECVWCHQRFPLNTAKDHVKCCGELETECSRCHAAVKRANGNSHNDECLMADIQCECGVLLKRAEADEHRRNMCALQEIVCPLKCGETVKRFVLFLYSALQD